MFNAQELVEAIHTDKLAEIDHHEAKHVCQAIGERVGSEMVDAIAHLDRAGIAARPIDDPTAPQQRHAGILDLTSADDAMAAVKALAAVGYEPWEPTDGPASAVHKLFRSELTLAKTTDLTMALTLRWPPSGLSGRIPSALVPNANDFDAITLPPTVSARLWPLYFLVRPARLVAERLGLRPQSNRALGPFLSTPDSLVRPLLEIAEIQPDDVVVDLGCGDGRIVMAAAEHYNCRAIGIESNADLVARGNHQAKDHTHHDQIEIINADAVETLRSGQVKGTVFFVFVPAEEASKLIHTLLDVTDPGTTVIAHEQHRLPNPPPGAESTPLLTDQGVTVAHRWRVG